MTNIQNSDATFLIGLAGAAGSGKSTVANRLKRQHGFWSYAFAKPIKDALKAMLGLTKERVDGDLKECVIEWLGRSPRYLMQTLGTEWGRQLVSKDIWLLCADRQLSLYQNLWRQRHRSKPLTVVISDVRFENEAKWIRERGGIIAHVIRDTGHIDEHTSEVGIQLVDGDWRLDNGGSLDDLHSLIDDMIASLSALQYYDLAVCGMSHG